MSDKPIQVGVIGLGRSGWRLHAAVAHNQPDRYRVAAVVDPEADRREEAKAHFGCLAYADYKELLANPEIELVVVATPSHTHAPLACAALDAAKHVLVEKPMATTVADADAMLDHARRAGKLLTIYQIRRNSPDFLKVKEVIDSGVLGPLLTIKLSVHGYDRRTDWQTLRKFGGGNLNNTGPHFVDQVLSLAGGEWRDAFVDLRHVLSAGDADDHVKLVFRGKDSVVADIEITSVSAGRPDHWFVMGKYGTLTGSTERLTWKYLDPAAMSEPQLDATLAAGRASAAETLPWIEVSADLVGNDIQGLFYERLHASLRYGAPLLVPPEEIRNLVALFDYCHTASGL